MAVLPLRFAPDPILRRKTRRVPTVDASIQKLIDDMIETMHDAYGVGLAAPQIGKSLRLAVIQVPEEEVLVLINPEIVKQTGECEVDEGCLSVPGYRGVIKRAKTVTVKAKDRENREYRVRGKELLAQALQHEIDHLDGKLYIDRMEDPTKLEKIETTAAASGEAG